MKTSPRRPAHFLALLCLAALFACSSSLKIDVSRHPELAAFDEKARLIMTDEELKIWKMLPDTASRQEFVEEFWKVRDPDPATDENEAEEEFEERVRYANTWFGTYNPRRGRDAPSEIEGQIRRGWNEDRGRIYIILGPPDTIQFIGPDGEQVSFDGSRIRPGAEQWTVEQWIYNRYRIAVLFRKSGAGAWHLEALNTHLHEVLDWAKLNWVSGDFREDIERRFKFRARFQESGILILIPVDRVSFDENFKAEFGVRINVYRNDKRVGTIEETKILEKSEDELFEMENIEFEIPCRAAEKGRYLFDVIIQDRMAPALSRYRVFIKRTV